MEKSPRSPRSIAEKLGESGGSGKVPGYCGACGQPKCDCKGNKPWGVEGNVKPGEAAKEPKPVKLGG
jgi:hypothetical protein